MLIALDTETTGKDFYHGAKPYFVTICKDGEPPMYWEWEVDPLNRQPIIPVEDVAAISREIEGCEIVMQNGKFDVSALGTINVPFEAWERDEYYDTLLAGHLLASNQPHNLTDMVIHYLGKDILPFEAVLKEACVEARKLAKKYYPEWMVAKHGLPCMPSLKKSSKGTEDSVWKNDAWLPRAIAKDQSWPADHSWWTVLSDYATVDSEATLALWKVQRAEIERQGLWEIYLESLKLPPILFGMEQVGVTIFPERAEELRVKYEQESYECRRACIELSGGEIDDLPVNGVSNALRHVLFDVFGLVSSKVTKKGNDSLDKDVLAEWLVSLETDSAAHKFITKLQAYRKRQTALSFIESYKKFWILNEDGSATIHGSINQTASVTLRMSMSNPNGQQISKQEIEEMAEEMGEEPKEGKSARYMFGPAEGREWWSLDYKNIERRIPVYVAGQEEIIALFEQPDEGPYYGSEHLLVAHTIRPEIFEECRNERGELDGRVYKKKYKATYYQYDKNGNFSKQYQGGKKKVDATYRRPGAYDMLQSRFDKLAALNDEKVALARKWGYVETMPDRSVNPDRGYPLLCARTEYNEILPTTPLNYWSQGTAVWIARKGMVNCQGYLDNLNRAAGELRYWMPLYVHDELVFDFPRGSGDRPWLTNLPKIRKLQQLMAEGGDEVGVPTPVGCEYHDHNWGEGRTL